MPQQPAQSAGRPGSALLILTAIFATAMFLRVPIGPRTLEPMAASLDATVLQPWSALPSASIDRPSLAGIRAVAPRAVLRTPAPVLEPILVTRLVSSHEMAPLEASPHPPGAPTVPPIVVPEPALASTAHVAMIGLAKAVVPVSYVESTSGPFGAVGDAVGTAFVKTGAALTLAFKKTGQGILAPF